MRVVSSMTASARDPNATRASVFAVIQGGTGAGCRKASHTLGSWRANGASPAWNVASLPSEVQPASEAAKLASAAGGSLRKQSHHFLFVAIGEVLVGLGLLCELLKLGLILLLERELDVLVARDLRLRGRGASGVPLPLFVLGAEGLADAKGDKHRDDQHDGAHRGAERNVLEVKQRGDAGERA